ncbi:MAG: hypothetical protein Q4F67_05785 [Propionibacteriaceae bacterium]|nr:hypothetical protein [Propionibacteriaceae bacterium]
MKLSPDQLANAIRDRDDLPLTSAQVFDQAEYFYPGTWKAKWPTGVPMPAVLTAVEDGSRNRQDVTRRHVFDASENVNSEADALNLYVIMCGWGAGPQGQTGYRCRLPLDQPDVGAKLLRTHQAIRGGADPVEVYRSLATGENRIKYFGPAFFTKWLYFSGYDTPTTQRKPLILDSRVAASLGWASWGWSPELYGQYLELAAEIAAKLDEAETHVVEHALYALNGDLIPARTESDLKTIVVSDIPEEVYELLTTQAESKALRVEEYTLELLQQAAEGQP